VFADGERIAGPAAIARKESIAAEAPAASGSCAV